MRISELLAEDRDPSLKYTIKYTAKKTANLADRVIVELEGNRSGVMTRLTKRYKRLDEVAKLLQVRRDAVNVQMKEESEALFDATDATLTRVVETLSATITLSKAERGADKAPKKNVDFEAIVKALGEMVPELTDKIVELTEKYTELVPAKDTPVALRVKLKTDEGLGAIVRKIQSYCTKLMSWLKSYDTRLDKLVAMVK
jgi:hypothetical protein